MLILAVKSPATTTICCGAFASANPYRNGREMMRQIEPYSLWLGHAGHLRDLRAVLATGIEAVVDLALNEPLAAVTRELVYCRFPLVDGPGNPPWLLRAAVGTVALLLRSGTPTLVCCGAGMSRSPAIVAGAIALVRGCTPAEALECVTAGSPCDVSPGLWQDVTQSLAVERI